MKEFNVKVIETEKPVENVDILFMLYTGMTLNEFAKYCVNENEVSCIKVSC